MNYYSAAYNLVTYNQRAYVRYNSVAPYPVFNTPSTIIRSEAGEIGALEALLDRLAWITYNGILKYKMDQIKASEREIKLYREENQCQKCWVYTQTSLDRIQEVMITSRTMIGMSKALQQLKKIKL